MSTTTAQNPQRPAQIGWGVAVVVAVLVYAARPQEELRSALFLGIVALAMLAWISLRPGRASGIVSLVLGTLWTLMFAAYVFAGLTADDARALIVVTDVVAVVGGVLIVWGSVMTIRRRRERREDVRRA